MTRNELFDEFVLDFTEKIKRFYGDKLEGVLQFGSTVRQLKVQTDLDILLVIRDLSNDRMQRYNDWLELDQQCASQLKRLGQHDIQLELSPIFKTPGELEVFNSFYLDIPTNSKILFDRTGALKIWIERIAKFIQDSGAVRKQRGDLYYWDLAPGVDFTVEKKIGW